MISAFDGDRLVGNASLSCVMDRKKTLHRATFGIAILKSDWGQGLGKKILSELAESEHLGKKSRETLARRLIDNEEDKIAQNLNKTDIVTKIGPTLGLMGTLIPMGPGLAALGTGDVTTLASAITIAFNTTVIGIGSGAIAYFASKLRRRWFGEYLANLDALMDAILDNIDKRDERLK